MAAARAAGGPSPRFALPQSLCDNLTLRTPVDADAPATVRDVVGGTPVAVAEEDCTLFDHGRALAARRIGRSAIAASETRPGPLVLEDLTATIYLPEAWHATADAQGNLLLRRR